MPKLHNNLAIAGLTVLKSVLNEQKRASRILSQTIVCHPKWGARDRKPLYTLVYDVLRWKRYYAFLLQDSNNNNTVDALLACWCKLNEYTSEILNEVKLITPPNPDSAPPAITASFPDWLFTLGAAELGSIWKKEYRALNEQAAVSLRVNRLKSSPKKVQSQLVQQFQIKSEWDPAYPDALLLSQGRKWDTNPLFKKGIFEIQDIHSQQIAPFTKVQPNDQVIDLCAGAGGKTLHLAALMRNQGLIKAFDIEANKLKELNKRAKRAGAKIIQVKCITSENDILGLKNWANVVLIDAPCSGLGTLKRNPEIKWRLTHEQLSKLLSIQKNLLQQAAGWVKPNGVITYATCSILPSENRLQVQSFLNTHPEFKLESDVTYYAHQSAFDGFYMARLRKKVEM